MGRCNSAWRETVKWLASLMEECSDEKYIYDVIEKSAAPTVT